MNEEVSIVKKNFINYIDKVIKNKKISHAYLVEIDNYENDSEYLFDFIKMILCDCSYHELINKNDKIISLIDSNNYPDIKVIEPDGNWIKKSQLLELQKEYSNKSLLGKKRIYIIKNAEKLNSSSANTMLKFLEEPEDDIIAFLITDNRYHVLDTILSRCQILNLRESCFTFNNSEELVDLLDCVLNPKNFFIKYNFLVNDVIADKIKFKDDLLMIENVFISYLNLKYSASKELDDTFTNMLNKVNDNVIIRCISIIEGEIPKLDYNVNYKLWLDSLFSKLVGGCING